MNNKFERLIREQNRRQDIATKVLISFTSSKELIEQVEDQIKTDSVYDHLAKQSVKFADALIRELDK